VEKEEKDFRETQLQNRGKVRGVFAQKKISCIKMDTALSSVIFGNCRQQDEVQFDNEQAEDHKGKGGRSARKSRAE